MRRVGAGAALKFSTGARAAKIMWLRDNNNPVAGCVTQKSVMEGGIFIKQKVAFALSKRWHFLPPFFGLTNPAQM
jgi:hypothetical protein